MGFNAWPPWSSLRQAGQRAWEEFCHLVLAARDRRILVVELDRSLLDGRASNLKVHRRGEVHHGEVEILSWVEILSEVEIHHLLLHRASRHLRRYGPHLCEVEIPCVASSLFLEVNHLLEGPCLHLLREAQTSK